MCVHARIFFLKYYRLVVFYIDEYIYILDAHAVHLFIHCGVVMDFGE